MNLFYLCSKKKAYTGLLDYAPDCQGVKKQFTVYQRVYFLR